MTFTIVATVLGWSGTVALLLAYGLVSTGRLSGRGRPFQLLNVFGSGGLGVAAVEGEVWSAATLNAVWVTIGVVTLAARQRQVGHVQQLDQANPQPDTRPP